MPGTHICEHGFVSHDGFVVVDGRFLARPYMVERVDGAQLRDMFVPNTTPATEAMLRKHSSFVMAQLMHYDIPFDEDTLEERGTKLLRQELIAGKVSRRPAIRALHPAARTYRKSQQIRTAY